MIRHTGICMPIELLQHLQSSIGRCFSREEAEVLMNLSPAGIAKLNVDMLQNKELSETLEVLHQAKTLRDARYDCGCGRGGWCVWHIQFARVRSCVRYKAMTLVLR